MAPTSAFAALMVTWLPGVKPSRWITYFLLYYNTISTMHERKSPHTQPEETCMANTRLV